MKRKAGQKEYIIGYHQSKEIMLIYPIILDPLGVHFVTIVIIFSDIYSMFCFLSEIVSVVCLL